MISPKTITLVFLTTIVLPCNCAYASKEIQSLNDLTKLADSFIKEYLSNNVLSDDFDVEVVEPDNRLKLKKCDGEIVPFWPYNPKSLGRMSVGLRCAGTVKWKVFLQSTIKQYRDVAVVNMPVNRGEILTPQMIGFRKVDVLSFRRGIVENYEPLIGSVFKQNVKSNTPISQHLLELPLLVKRGDLVRLITSGNLVSVGAEVEVLSDGYAQQRINVKNTRSGKTITATVVGKNLVSTEF